MISYVLLTILNSFIRTLWIIFLSFVTYKFILYIGVSETEHPWFFIGAIVAFVDSTVRVPQSISDKEKHYRDQK